MSNDKIMLEKKTFKYKDYEVSYYDIDDKVALCTDGIIDFNEKFLYFNSIDELKIFIDGYNLRNRYLQDIQYLHQNILIDFTSDVAYHTSPIKNRDDILKNGLVSGKNISTDLLRTSLFMDSHRTRNIPSNFYRTSSIYLYPKYTEWIEEAEFDLYAVDIKDLDWYIASYSLSGFCLCSLMNSDDKYENINKKECLKWTRLYWHNCYSKEEFLKQTDEVKQSESLYGLTEILVPFKIPADRIAHIGKFIQGRFLPNENFQSFVKDEYKNSYRKILINHLTR